MLKLIYVLQNSSFTLNIKAVRLLAFKCSNQTPQRIVYRLATQSASSLVTVGVSSTPTKVNRNQRHWNPEGTGTGESEVTLEWPRVHDTGMPPTASKMNPLGAQRLMVGNIKFLMRNRWNQMLNTQTTWRFSLKTTGGNLWYLYEAKENSYKTLKEEKKCSLSLSGFQWEHPHFSNYTYIQNKCYNCFCQTVCTQFTGMT